MKKWYRVSDYSDGVKEVDVIRETEQCIYLHSNYYDNGEKQLKNSNDKNYFIDLKEAIKFKLKIINDNIENKKRNLKYAEDELKEFEANYKSYIIMLEKEGEK